MSYEFNPETRQFELPNPYKVENLGLIIAGTLMIAAGVMSMVLVRDRFAQGLAYQDMAVVAIAVALLGCGITLFARAFTQLHYFFGRNRPESLAPLVPFDQDGDSQHAAYFKDTLRQNAITFREPTGALNGLLYSWLPHLIFAPDVIQRTAQAQFYNCLALAATLLSFGLCWLVVGQQSASGWIGVFYGAFALFQILRPMARRSSHATAAATNSTKVGRGSLILLIVLALLGPAILAVLGPRLPDLGHFSINDVLLVALACALLGCAIFGLALKNQLQPSPQAVGAARVTETVTMNAHPNKLIEELDRILMARWYGQIPNRRYTRRSPAIHGQQGQFSAEIFEETQPRPQPNRVATGIGHAFSVPQFRWSACLTGLATLFLGMGALAAVLAVQSLLAGRPAVTALSFALSQLAVGLFCYRAGHVLWGRFDFVSELIWVDIAGSFESARVNIGNQLTGNVHTAKNVINIETMTMRVWVSEVDTVIFGKDERRQLIGMRGLQHVAEELTAALKGFGETRSMVVAPSNVQDLERAQKIGAVNHVVAAPAPHAAEHMAKALAASKSAGVASGTSTAIEAAVRSLFCTGCGSKLDMDARFCGECGDKVSAPALSA